MSCAQRCARNDWNQPSQTMHAPVFVLWDHRLNLEIPLGVVASSRRAMRLCEIPCKSMAQGAGADTSCATSNRACTPGTTTLKQVTNKLQPAVHAPAAACIDSTRIRVGHSTYPLR